MTTTATTPPQYNHSFALPPLYFASRGGVSLSATSSSSSSSSTTTPTTTPTTPTTTIPSIRIELPSEVLVHIVSFGDWGDVRRVSRVQSAWSTLLDDVAATQRPHSTWSLAQALRHGTHGLDQPNVPHAMQLLRQLANVNEKEDVLEEEAAALGDHDDDFDENALDAAALDHTNNNNNNNNNQHQQQQQHFAPAMKQLAYCYLTNAYDNTTLAQVGLRWLQRAHTLGGDVSAAYEVALLYEYGRLVHGEDPFSTNTTTTNTTNNTNNNNTTTNNTKTTLIDIDVVAAAAWFRRAAHAGHVDAMTELALCYELGCGVPQNDERAVDWYRRAAERGHITAKYAVGEAFEAARGVPQSDAEACLWYYKAAVQGDEDSRQALHRLRDIARIVVPGVTSLLGEAERAGNARP